MAKSMYKIKFKQNIELENLCKVKLDENDLNSLRSAIEELFYFEFVVGKC
jgi:transmembrane 9 superfamily member 1